MTPYSEKQFIEIFSNNKTSELTSDPQSVIDSHKVIFDFMEKMPGTFCFIYDFFNAKYILVSKSIRSVLGVSEEVMLQGGFQNALQFFHPDDRDNISYVHKELFNYLFQQPIEELKKYRFDFNYRIQNSQGNYIQLLQQTVFTTILDGKPLYDFSTCTDVTIQKRNNRLELSIYKQMEDTAYELVHEYVVPATIGFGLSTTEFKILKLTASGLSSRQIADRSFRSIHTINNHRRNILSKTNSGTVAEAILKVDI